MLLLIVKEYDEIIGTLTFIKYYHLENMEKIIEKIKLLDEKADGIFLEYDIVK